MNTKVKTEEDIKVGPFQVDDKVIVKAFKSIGIIKHCLSYSSTNTGNTMVYDIRINDDFILGTNSMISIFYSREICKYNKLNRLLYL